MFPNVSTENPLLQFNPLLSIKHKNNIYFFLQEPIMYLGSFHILPFIDFSFLENNPNYKFIIRCVSLAFLQEKCSKVVRCASMLLDACLTAVVVGKLETCSTMY